MVRPALLELVTELFSDTELEITTEGVRYLGSAIGTADFRATFLQDKVVDWIKELEQLIRFAQTEPHAAYSAHYMDFVAVTRFSRHTASCKRHFVTAGYVFGR